VVTSANLKLLLNFQLITVKNSLVIISSYLSCQMIEAETSARTVQGDIIYGIPQDSVLRSTLRNVVFNGIFKVSVERLSVLMSNLGGLAEIQRQMLMDVAMLVLL
jgi:hypothetical protein